jgi:hypothetical protein
MRGEPNARANAPDCLRCQGYYVTHEPVRPHGCRSFGFQSARLPCDEVRLASGAECAAIEPRARTIAPERKRLA